MWHCLLRDWHTLDQCPRWEAQRQTLTSKVTINVEEIVRLILQGENQCEMINTVFSLFAEGEGHSQQDQRGPHQQKGTQNQLVS